MNKKETKMIDQGRIIFPKIEPPESPAAGVKGGKSSPDIFIIQEAVWYWSRFKCHGFWNAVPWLKHTWHNTGETRPAGNGGIQLAAHSLGHQPQHLTFGTYENFSSGIYEAQFLIAYWWEAYQEAAWNDVIAVLDITADCGQRVIAQRQITPADFNDVKPTQRKWFGVKTDFQNRSLDNFEARVFWCGKDSFSHDQTVVYHWI